MYIHQFIIETNTHRDIQTNIYSRSLSHTHLPTDYLATPIHLTCFVEGSCRTQGELMQTKGEHENSSMNGPSPRIELTTFFYQDGHTIWLWLMRGIFQPYGTINYALIFITSGQYWTLDSLSQRDQNRTGRKSNHLNKCSLQNITNTFFLFWNRKLLQHLKDTLLLFDRNE